MSVKTRPAVKRGTIPKTMHAVAIDRSGGPEVLTMHTLPVPVPTANEVLIAVHTAEVGGWDAEIRDGWSPDGKKPRFPLVLGGGGSGTVAAVGSRVRRFQEGEPVYAYAWNYPRTGFYAEYAVVPDKSAAAVPSPLDLEHAGAVPIAGITALQGIDDALHVKKDERVIIYGASGGLGVFAIQFAKLRGARVLAIASGPNGVALVRRLGADAVVDGHAGDIAMLRKSSRRKVSTRSWRLRVVGRSSAASTRSVKAGGSPIRTGSSPSRSAGAGSRRRRTTGCLAVRSSNACRARSRRRGFRCRSRRSSRWPTPCTRTSGWRRGTFWVRSCSGSVDGL